jgi:hypothetical protein
VVWQAFRVHILQNRGVVGGGGGGYPGLPPLGCCQSRAGLQWCHKHYPRSASCRTHPHSPLLPPASAAHPLDSMSYFRGGVGGGDCDGGFNESLIVVVGG